MTGIQTLNGPWTLWFGPDDGRTCQSQEEARALGYQSIPAAVPGNVELDLMAAGLEPDPLLGDHLPGFEKYEYYNWLYIRTFTANPPPERDAFLLLKGVNTFARVVLNGRALGRCENMLIAYEFNVTDCLLPGENTLAVFIRSAMNEARQARYPVAFVGAEHSHEMTRLRMPPHSFGWDIMPRLLSAGLWRDALIEYRPRERFTEAYLATTALERGAARLRLAYAFETPAPGPLRYTVAVEGRCGNRAFAAEQTTHFVSNCLEFSVEDPALWWPRGMGEAALYDVAVTLLRDGRVCDRKAFRFGIRTAAVDMDFSPAPRGRFQVVVNGRPVFIHGSNWVPLSALHSLDEGRADRALQLAAGCGCNALRCWGGNVYESDHFYDRCDELGLLIWQDFAIACTLPPQDDAFAAVLAAEAAQIIRRLRNHASLLLWAGDNEVDMFYGRYPAGHARYNRITREVLPRACAAHDPMRPYLPSSPYVPEGLAGSDGPEQHLWGPRDDFKGDFYRLNNARFASEIGYHGCPAVSSLKRFISPEQLWPWQGSNEWRLHNTESPLYGRGYDRNELMAKQAAILFGTAPEALVDFVFASQFSQAEAKKFFIEQFRMNKGEKTGILWWNLIDGWPQISDAVVDYFWHAKLAYHFISRVQKPVQLMIGEYDRWEYPLWAVNDTLEPVVGQYRVWNGETGETAAEGEFALPADGREKLAAIPANPADKGLYLIRWEMGGESFVNHYIAGRAPFDLKQARDWVRRIAAQAPEFNAEGCYS